MDETRAQAMLSELQQQVLLLSTRAATLAADAATANQRIQTLTEQVEKQAEELAKKDTPPDLKSVA